MIEVSYRLKGETGLSRRVVVNCSLTDDYTAHIAHQIHHTTADKLVDVYPVTIPPNTVLIIR